MDTKTKFARRKKLISLILFGMACLMLSLFFIRTTFWGIIVITFSIILTGISLRLNRCPECNAKIHNDDADKCENCGCQLR